MQQLTTHSTQGETRWLADEHAASELLGPQGLRLDEWQQAGLLKTVKTGPHRSVYRVQLPSGGYYVKHYRVRDWKAFVQNLVRPSKAILEWEAARKVAAAGVPTFETVAIGRTVSGGFTWDSFLASREIEETESLRSFASSRLRRFPANRRGAIRRNLAEQLGRLLAALHRGRLIHPDLHAENVLVRVASNDSVLLWLIDLHSITGCRRLTLQHVERSLALLYPALTHHVSRTDRAHFFQRYWQALLAADDENGEQPPHLARLAFPAVSQRVDAYCRQDVIRVWRKRDLKWSRGNRRLIIADGDHVRCRGLATLGREQLLAIRDDPDALLVRSGEEDRGEGSSPRTNVVSLSGRDGEIECHVLRFERPRLSGRQRLCGAQAECRRAWEGGHALLRRGIPAPRPLAFVEVESGETSRQFLLTENIPGAVRLDRYLCDELPSLDESTRERRLGQITGRLANELRRLHESGFNHRSISPETLLVSPDESGLLVWFVSLEDVQQRRRLPRRRSLDALARLNAGFAAYAGVRLVHRLRFLKRYLSGRPDGDWKNAWREIQGRLTSMKAASESRVRVVTADRSLPAQAKPGDVRRIDIPKGLPGPAQGQRRSRATLGYGATPQRTNSNGVP